MEVAEVALRGKLAQPAARQRITVQHIQRVVCAYYGLTLEELRRRTRVRSIARPRMMAMYLCCQHTTASLPEIGRRFANPGDKPFDHTTVIHAREEIPKLAAGKEPHLLKDIEALERKIFDPA